jgi:hypothetical protein
MRDTEHQPSGSSMGIPLRYHPVAGRFAPGQTLAEYGTILLAIAILVYGGYLVFGADVAALINSINPLF